MKRYCFDTSGFSNPLETTPDDIHGSMWRGVVAMIEKGSIAVTTEIYDEMVLLGGIVGECIRDNPESLVLEVDEDSWLWPLYVENSRRMQIAYCQYIAENRKKTAGTISLADLSIVALGKTLDLPVVSMERRVPDPSRTERRKIPDICDLEAVLHLDWNDFLRKESFNF